MIDTYDLTPHLASGDEGKWRLSKLVCFASLIEG